MAQAHTSPDLEAWKVAAATRKYRIHDGKVWSGGAGMLFSLDPIPGFASLPEAIQPLVFQSVAQFVTNRIGQVAEGDVQAAITEGLTKGKIPSANTNDAFERHYIATVTARVNAVRPLAKDASAEDKAKHEHLVEVTAIKNRGGLPPSGQAPLEQDKFVEFRDAGIAAARNKPTTEKKKRAAKASVDLGEAMDI